MHQADYTLQNELFEGGRILFIASKECKEALDQIHKRFAAVWMRLLCLCVRKLPLSTDIISIISYTYP